MSFCGIARDVGDSILGDHQGGMSHGPVIGEQNQKPIIVPNSSWADLPPKLLSGKFTFPVSLRQNLRCALIPPLLLDEAAVFVFRPQQTTVPTIFAQVTYEKNRPRGPRKIDCIMSSIPLSVTEVLNNISSLRRLMPHDLEDSFTPISKSMDLSTDISSSHPIFMNWCT